MKNRRMFAGVLVLSLGLLAGSGLAQFDEDWHGTWEFDSELRDCVTGFLLFEDVNEYIFCEGEDFESDTDPNWDDIDCQGGVTGNQIDLLCTMTEEIDVDCTAHMTMTWDLTLDQGVVTGTQTIETDFVGAGCFVTYTCIEATVVGTRIDADPVECDPQPNEAASWSTVKGIYR